MPMYVYVVNNMFCPLLFIELFTRRTLKLNLQFVVVVVLSYIYVYLHISHTFFLIPFNKNFLPPTNQPTTIFGCLKISFIFTKGEDWLPKNFPINHRQRRETTTTLILILILYTRRQLIDYTPTKDTITLGATPIDITVSFCIKQLLLPQ